MPRMAKQKKIVSLSSALTISLEQLLVNGSDAAFRQLIHNILAFGARMQQLSGKLGEVIGLSSTQYLILIAIRHHQGESGAAGVNQIAKQLHLSSAFMTLEINKLVAAGLVLKRINPDDRRRVLLSLTPMARKLLVDLTAVQRPANDILFESLSRSDFEALGEIMSSLVDSCDRALSLVDYLSKEAGQRQKLAALS